MGEKEGKIIIIDDDPEILLSGEMILEDYFSEVYTMEHPEGLEEKLDKENIDVLLLDMNFSRGKSDGEEGLHWLTRAKEIDPNLSIVMITAYGDIELSVKAIKQGAFDFVLKPWKNAKLLATSLSAYKYTQSLRRNNKLQSTQQTLQSDSNRAFDEIIGSSPAIKQLKETISKVAPTNASVLILGENGTGKELVARAIHNQSERYQQIFIPVDLGSLSDTLFESELFGHVKGAFTDAKQDKAGRFELASGGSIFLDEIGNLPLQLQSKLLTVLQNQQINRVGSAKSINVDFRLISATNSPIQEMIKNDKFRQDLYYRMNTFEIKIPPLRERKEDISELTEYFVNKLKKKYNRPNLKINKQITNQLKKHDWPGNIRELKNTLERAVILSENNKLDLKHVTLSNIRPDVNTDSLNIEENEKKLILKALDKTNGNITRAAKELGLRRNALYRRLEKYGLQ